MSAAQPATFLELSQRTAEEAGVAGSQAGTVPATTSGLTGELRRIVGWVRDAWAEIQGQHHFNWMWERATVAINAATNVTAQDIPASRYVTTDAYLIDTQGSNFWLDYLDWDTFRRQYTLLDLATNNPITVWSIRPDNAIVVNTTPLLSTNLYIERYKNPTQLAVDGDEPGMPLDLRMLIVYKALIRYANSDEAGTMRMVWQAEVIRLERDLMRRCLPVMRLGGPLGDED